MTRIESSRGRVQGDFSSTRLSATNTENNAIKEHKR